VQRLHAWQISSNNFEKSPSRLLEISLHSSSSPPVAHSHEASSLSRAQNTCSKGMTTVLGSGGSILEEKVDLR